MACCSAVSQTAHSKQMVGEPAVLIVTSEGLKVMERTSDAVLCNIFIKVNETDKRLAEN